MKFAQALELLKEGHAVKLPHWAGYWKKEGDTIMMHCRDGEVVNILYTEDVFYTLGNIASEEWMSCEPAELPVTATMNFGKALRKAKSGCLIARKGWNGKGMAVAYCPGYPDGVSAGRNMAHSWHIPIGEEVKIRPYLQMLCSDGTYQMWLASQSDILADDWYIVE